jgi:hypothetical protein
MALEYPKSPQEFCNYFGYPPSTIWQKQKALTAPGSEWSNAQLIAFRVTSEVLAHGVNPLLRPHYADAQRLANEQLSAGLTEIHGWAGLRGSDLLKLAGTYASLYQALQQTIQPRRPEPGQAESDAAGPSLRPRKNVAYASEDSDEESGPSSTSAVSEAGDDAEDDTEASIDSAATSGMPRSDPSVGIELPSNVIEYGAGTPSSTGSSMHSPPHKRGRFNSPYSSPARPEAATADVATPPLSHHVSTPERQLRSAAISQQASPTSASALSPQASMAPSGSIYSQTSNVSDVSALVDVAKGEPVTMQLVAAYLSAVFNHADSGTSVPVDYAANQQEVHVRLGMAKYCCINDGSVAYKGLVDGIWGEIGRLIAASVEAKPKPPQYAADREASRVVSCKVLGQQSSQLLGMLHDRLAFFGIIDGKSKPADDAKARIAALSEHQRTWVPSCHHQRRFYLLAVSSCLLMSEWGRCFLVSFNQALMSISSVTFPTEYVYYLLLRPEMLSKDGTFQMKDKKSVTLLPYMHVIESPRWNLVTDDGRLDGAKGLLALRFYWEEHGRIG